VLENFLNAWRVPDLRTKLLFTAAMLAVYRLGSHLPAPAVNPDAINVGGSSFLNLLNTFSGGGLSRLSIFALGIMPYITASIILQVMTPVFPSLQALQKEGELGQRRITQYTRYLTVALAAAQSLGYAYAFANNSSLLGATSLGNVLVDHSLRSYVLVVMTLTAGATLLMWIGELITQKGIGNGMSLLIFSSILTSAPAGINAWWNGSGFEKLSLPIVILAVVTGVVYVQEGIRKIPIQYAKRMVGRRMTSGGSTYLPLRVNMAGVIPVIFASAIMILPATVASLLPGTLGPRVAQWFQFTSWPYIIGESLLIFAFTFFYVAVVFNSLEQADNLKKYGGFIPGIRPGRPTAEYLSYVLSRITFAGALYLGVIAVLPNFFLGVTGSGNSAANNFPFGGTAVLIMVGVGLDTVKQIESQLMQRNYEGFLR
jgi:preprotein translocase subunit SecY